MLTSAPRLPTRLPHRAELVQLVSRMVFYLLLSRLIERGVWRQLGLMLGAVAEFGILEVRVYFRYDTLCIEVFCAKDVIPLDPNGNKIFS